jgi:hypothetical protein
MTRCKARLSDADVDIGVRLDRALLRALDMPFGEQASETR